MVGDVRVTGASHGDTLGDAPFDPFALGFASVTITYRPQLATGAAGPPAVVTFP